MPLRAGSTVVINGKKVRVWRTAEDDTPEASRAAIFGAAEETTRLSKANQARIMSKRQAFRKKKTSKDAKSTT